jgi:hypothetical protein
MPSAPILMPISAKESGVAKDDTTFPSIGHPLKRAIRNNKTGFATPFFSIEDTTLMSRCFRAG